MIQKETLLNVIDNSGAKLASCIHVCGGYRNRYAFSGSIVVVTVKCLRMRRLNKKSLVKVQKSDVLKALVVRTKIKSFFSNVDSLCFFENSIVLLNNQYKMLGTRVFGAVPSVLRYGKFARIASLSLGLVN
jgi:large subunit ribosomal protein L14